jgi:hypothetical protein
MLNQIHRIDAVPLATMASFAATLRIAGAF